MKKIMIILIALLIVIAVTLLILAMIHTSKDELENAQIRKICPPLNTTPKYSDLNFDVYETNTRYIITVADEGVGVEFSKDRKCQAYFGIIPIKSKETHEYVNKEFSLVEKRFGKYHIDIGSGFFIPAYITEDGYLICFHIENNLVTCVQKLDLFTGEYINP